MIAEHVPATLDGERRLALEHCVILHHGPDASSGQRFASPEALALYRVNALDARVKGVLEHGAAGLPEGGRHTGPERSAVKRALARCR